MDLCSCFQPEERRCHWPAWAEKFLSNATRKEIKEVLVDDTIAIPKSNQVLDEAEEMDHKKLAIWKTNALTYNKLILSIFTTQSGGKVAFSIVTKGSNNSADYKDGNANKAWKGWRQNTNPIRLQVEPSYIARSIRANFARRWIRGMDHQNGRFEDTSWQRRIFDDRRLFHDPMQILNSLMHAYLLEVKLMEKQKQSKDRTIDSWRNKNELSLAYKR